MSHLETHLETQQISHLETQQISNQLTVFDVAGTFALNGLK